MKSMAIAVLASIFLVSDAQAKPDSCRLDLEATRPGAISYIVLNLNDYADGEIFVRLPIDDLPKNSDVHVQIDNNAPWRMSDFSEPMFFAGDTSGKRGYSVGITDALIRQLFTEMTSGVRMIVFDANRRGIAATINLASKRYAFERFNTCIGDLFGILLKFDIASPKN